MRKNDFLQGLVDGLPICFGYLTVSFAFGIYAVSSGLKVWEALLLSMTNTTSAGEIAAVPLLAGGGTLLELLSSQLIINMRYALMSLSLTQKLDGTVRFRDRLVIAFVHTDEVFATAANKEGLVGRHYLYGLILTPWIGWSTGTLIGAVAGNFLPASVVSALGIAVYALLIAVIVPRVKREVPLLVCSAVAVALSCAFRYLPTLKEIPSGFAITLIAVITCTAMALLRPIGTKEDAA